MRMRLARRSISSVHSSRGFSIRGNSLTSNRAVFASRGKRRPCAFVRARYVQHTRVRGDFSACKNDKRRRGIDCKQQRRAENFRDHRWCVPATWQLLQQLLPPLGCSRGARRFFGRRCRFLMFACPQKAAKTRRPYRRRIAAPIFGRDINTRAIMHRGEIASVFSRDELLSSLRF